MYIVQNSYVIKPNDDNSTVLAAKSLVSFRRAARNTSTTLLACYEYSSEHFVANIRSTLV